MIETIHCLGFIMIDYAYDGATRNETRFLSAAFKGVSISPSFRVSLAFQTSPMGLRWFFGGTMLLQFIRPCYLLKGREASSAREAREIGRQMLHY